MMADLDYYQIQDSDKYQICLHLQHKNMITNKDLFLVAASRALCYRLFCMNNKTLNKTVKLSLK